MNSGIEITDTELRFTEFTSVEIGVSKYCKSFTLSLNEINLIGISPRLALDDESLFLIVVDRSGNIFPIPDNIIGTKGLKLFEKYFELNPIQDEWKKFNYEEHYGDIDKVLYPKEKYWNDFFCKDWKLRFRTLYAWFKPKTFFGNLNTNNL